MSNLTGTLADGPVAADSIGLEQTASFNEGVGFVEAWAWAYIAGSGGLADKLKFSEGFALQLRYGLSIAQPIVFRESLLAAYNLSLVQGLHLSSTLAPAMGHLIAEALKVSALQFTTAKMSISVSQLITLLSGFSNMNGLALTDAFGVVEGTLLAEFFANSAVNELVRLTDNAANILVAHIQMPEGVDLDDDGLCNFIYNVGLSDNVWADVTYQQPGSNTVTTWVINTRTNAVTQYRNFAFNSFASIGRKFIAADENGLYELNGSRDLTANVIGHFGGGYFQPTDGMLAGLKGVYIGVKGQGPGAGGVWYLKLKAGDGREYIYRRLSNPNLMTTKFDVGKGLRSRYFAWELFADGQDFDFDDVKFVPMGSGRNI